MTADSFMFVEQAPGGLGLVSDPDIMTPGAQRVDGHLPKSPYVIVDVNRTSARAGAHTTSSRFL